MRTNLFNENPYFDFIISRFFGLCILLMAFSCDKTPTCEMDNTGTFIIENTSRTGTLYVFINERRPSINGPGDLQVAPGEKGKIAVPAGQHNIKASIRVTRCNNGRCGTTSSGQPERTVDLFACEDKNLVY